MGKGKSYEIVEYRNKIINAICQNERLVKLMGFTPDNADEMIWNGLYPHEYIPEVETDEQRYIAFDILFELNPRNRAFRNMALLVYVGAHEDNIKYMEDGRVYRWDDLVTCELDEMFTEKNIFGVGKLELESSKPYYSQLRFKGRRLSFVIPEFANGAKYGK